VTTTFVGLRGGGADPAEVLGEREPQLGRAGELAVGEAGVGQLGQRPAQRSPPGAAREQREVGRAGEEVDARDRRRHGCRWRRRSAVARGLGAGRDPGPGAAARDQVALGRELFVGLDDEAAGDAELGGQRPRGGQPRLRAQPADPDCLAQLGFELGAPRPPGVPLWQQQLGRGR
jgi:hypothetical protein